MANEMKKLKGVTLLEVLMVLVIVSMILAMFIGYIQQRTAELRRSRTATQIELILNAGQAYYVANNTWPTSLTAMSNAGFLPPSSLTLANSWGYQFNITGIIYRMFYVSTQVASATEAQLIAGRLPLGFISSTPPPFTPVPCDTTSTIPAACNYVVGTANVPAQNVNNATAANFGSIYHSGACVPVPVCPMHMVPQILAIPVAVSGVNEDPAAIPGNDCGGGNDYTKCKQIMVHPITGYTTNAYGPGYWDKGAQQIRSCMTSKKEPCYQDVNKTPMPPGKYWRVCLYVNTEISQVIPSGNGMAQGQAMGNILAITRCAPEDEYVGSSFDVFQ